MRIITLYPVTSELEMFDNYTDTQTEEADQIQESFDCSGCNCVMLLNNYGITANLTVSDGGGEFYNETVSLIRDSIKDWWDYFFAPVRTGRDLIFYFPARPGATAIITIDYPGGTAKCGFCKPGIAMECGLAKYGVDIGITDYSITTADETGTYFSVGAWAKTADADIMYENTSLDAITQKIVENRGVPTGFDYNQYQAALGTGHTSLDGLSCLIIYGYTEKYKPTLDEPIANEYSHTAQGLI